MAAKSSAQALRVIWESFAALAKESPERAKLSKREVSVKILGAAGGAASPNTLSNWLNEAKRNPIPLLRIPEVCLRLKASPKAQAELIGARLLEMIEEDPSSDVALAMDWLLAAQELSEDESALVEQYRQANSVNPYRILDRPARVAVIREALDVMVNEDLTEHNTYLEDHRHLDGTEEELAQMRAQRATMFPSKALTPMRALSSDLGEGFRTKKFLIRHLQELGLYTYPDKRG